MFLRRNWSSACSESSYAGGWEPKHTSDFHLIKLNEDEEAVNFTSSSSMCSIVNIACTWIKYDETSGFTGDIFF